MKEDLSEFELEQKILDLLSERRSFADILTNLNPAQAEAAREILRSLELLRQSKEQLKPDPALLSKILTQLPKQEKKTLDTWSAALSQRIKIVLPLTLAFTLCLILILAVPRQAAAPGQIQFAGIPPQASADLNQITSGLLQDSANEQNILETGDSAKLIDTQSPALQNFNNLLDGNEL